MTQIQRKVELLLLFAVHKTYRELLHNKAVQNTGLISAARANAAVAVKLSVDIAREIIAVRLRIVLFITRYSANLFAQIIKLGACYHGHGLVVIRKLVDDNEVRLFGAGIQSAQTILIFARKDELRKSRILRLCHIVAQDNELRRACLILGGYRCGYINDLFQLIVAVQKNDLIKPQIAHIHLA